MSRITQALAAWLAAGETRMGELVITGRYEVRHYLDAGLENLTTHEAPETARQIALYDAAGNYRPLKTAPNLRRGWRLVVPALEQLHEALDGFYPAMLAARLAFQENRLAVTPLTATLNRQSGMYAVAKKLTNAEADKLIGGFCRTDGGCLKKILWPIAPAAPVSSLPAEKFEPGSQEGCIPLLCAEACNLLVAKAREAVKQRATHP